MKSTDLLRLAALPTVAAITPAELDSNLHLLATAEPQQTTRPRVGHRSHQRPLRLDGGGAAHGVNRGERRAAAERQIRAQQPGDGPSKPVVAASGPREPQPITPDGWFDVGAGHGGRDAWALGYRGSGVQVAILDSGVDFAHPDLAGTWAILGEGDPGAGWPYVYDPLAAYAYLLDATEGITSQLTAQGVGSLIHMYQAAEVTASPLGITACLRPIAPHQDLPVPPIDCRYRVPPSQTGMVRYGHHPAHSPGWMGGARRRRARRRAHRSRPLGACWGLVGRCP